MSTWNTAKAEIAALSHLNHDEKLDEFQKFGEELNTRFHNADLDEQTVIFTLAEVYKLGTYRTEESQVSAAWNEHMSTFDAVELDECAKFLRQTSDGKKKLEWLRNNVEAGSYRRVCETLENDGLTAAMDVLVNMRGEENEILGSNPAKVAMSALLIGESEAFVLDRNVAEVAARYWQSTALLPSVELPTCSACYNSYFSNTGNLPLDEHKEIWGFVDEYRKEHGTDHPFKDEKVHAYDLEYFREKHLKREHLKSYGDWSPYAEMLQKRVGELYGRSVSMREMTQILFNVGMLGGEKSTADASKFYTHETFYQSMTA